MLKLYAAATTVEHIHGEIEVRPVVVLATNTPEAEGKALQKLREFRPLNGGWRNHLVYVMDVPQPYIIEAFAAIVNKDAQP